MKPPTFIPKRPNSIAYMYSCVYAHTQLRRFPVHNCGCYQCGEEELTLFTECLHTIDSRAPVLSPMKDGSLETCMDGIKTISSDEFPKQGTQKFEQIIF